MISTLFILAALVGATLIVVRGTLFRRVRAIWPSFLGCSQCVGFWIGVLAAATSPPLLSVRHDWRLDAPLLGCALSLLAMSVDLTLLWLGGGSADK
jgi:hypothetical protein